MIRKGNPPFENVHWKERKPTTLDYGPSTVFLNKLNIHFNTRPSFEENWHKPGQEYCCSSAGWLAGTKLSFNLSAEAQSPESLD